MHLNGQYERALVSGHAVIEARKAGRPTVGRVTMNTTLKPDIKQALEQLAKLHKKSKGEIIEMLVEKTQRNEVTL